MATTIDTLYITNQLRVPEDAISAQTRETILKQDTKRFPVKLTDFRVWNAVETNLPGTAASDDLGIINGTWGTHPLMIQAGDLKNAGATTRYARVEVQLPECYVAAQAVTIIVSGGMTTTVASVSSTVGLEVYRRDKITGISADLCATAAITINSLTFGDKSFTITASALGPGDVLDVRMAVACNDSGTGTAVIPTVASFDLQCACKG
jgi:hypothetical protein